MQMMLDAQCITGARAEKYLRIARRLGHKVQKKNGAWMENGRKMLIPGQTINGCCAKVAAKRFALAVGKSALYRMYPQRTAKRLQGRNMAGATESSTVDISVTRTERDCPRYQRRLRLWCPMCLFISQIWFARSSVFRQRFTNSFPILWAYKARYARLTVTKFQSIAGVYALCSAI